MSQNLCSAAVVIGALRVNRYYYYNFPVVVTFPKNRFVLQQSLYISTSHTGEQSGFLSTLPHIVVLGTAGLI